MTREELIKELLESHKTGAELSDNFYTSFCSLDKMGQLAVRSCLPKRDIPKILWNKEYSLGLSL